MGNKTKVVIEFDFIGYRKHLFEMKEHFKNVRDEYKYNTLMWNMFDNVVYTILTLIDDMDDYAVFEEVKNDIR